ncbi:hypothetical protein BH11PLA1_BH11PLA1_09360 [soil metagenome]
MMNEDSRRMRPAAFQTCGVYTLAALGLAFVGSLAAARTNAHPAAAAPPRAAESAARDAAPIFVKQDLQAALAASRQQNMLLIVELAGTPDRQRAAEARWQSECLRAWAKQHAIVVCVTDKPTIKTLSEAGINQGSGADPLVFRDAGYLRLFGVSARTSVPEGDAGKATFSTRQESRIPRPKGALPPGFDLLLKLDWTLRGVARKDAPWLAAHEAAAKQKGEAAWPARLLCSTASDGVPAFTDPASTPEQVTEVFTKASTFAASEKPEDRVMSAAMFTWLWEVAPTRLPQFEPARLLVVAARMKALADASPPAKARFEALYRTRLVNLNPGDQIALWDVLTLARIVGAHDGPLEFIDSALNDGDATAMMPVADKFNLETLLPRAHFNLVEGDLAALKRRVENDVRALNRAKPHALSDEQWAAASAFRAYALTVEAARSAVSAVAIGVRNPEAKADAAKSVAELAAAAKAGAPGATGLSGPLNPEAAVRLASELATK